MERLELSNKIKQSIKLISKVPTSFIDNLETEVYNKHPTPTDIGKDLDGEFDDRQLTFDFNDMEINPNHGMNHQILSRFYILRHGQTDTNLNLAGGGTTKPIHNEPQLTELGYLQSYLTGTQMANHMKDNQTYDMEVSPMIRAVETLLGLLLGILSKKYIKVNLFIDDRMIEIRGHKISDYHGLTSNHFKDIFLPLNDFLNYKLRDTINEYGYWFKNDAIEQHTEFLTRIRDKYYNGWINYRKTTIIIGHSIWISRFITHLENDNPDTEFHLVNLSINAFDLTDTLTNKGKLSREWHKLSYSNHLPITWRTGHHIPQF